MLEILFGVAVGSVGTYFVIRFKNSLMVFKNRTEKEIEKKLKGE